MATASFVLSPGRCPCPRRSRSRVSVQPRRAGARSELAGSLGPDVGAVQPAGGKRLAPLPASSPAGPCAPTRTWDLRTPEPGARVWAQRSMIAAVPPSREAQRRGGSRGRRLCWGNFPAKAPSCPRLRPLQRGSAREFKMESLSRAGQEMSLAALKQHDPYITSIADLTGQVALYTFCPKANQWVSARRPLRSTARPPPLKGAARTVLGGR